MGPKNDGTDKPSASVCSSLFSFKQNTQNRQTKITDTTLVGLGGNLSHYWS